uniref:Rho-GAP domain-containing protein n=2 Tax=Timema TaxID=61471 RepID=A0A7R8VE05_TIMDO|nr:unnamed protein product [Timema douglasi]
MSLKYTCGCARRDWCTMRRPTICANTDNCYSSGFCNFDKDEGRLARMKRALAGTLLGAGRARTFGLRLDELPTSREGVPFVVVRLCTYISLHGLHCGGVFRLSAGNPKLVEQLRAAFDHTGDADLEGTNDVASVASLLKLWLRELPEPVILNHVAQQLLDITEKEKGEWCKIVSGVLAELPEQNQQLLGYLLQFLHCYEYLHHPKCHHSSGGVAAIFSPLLLVHSAPFRIQDANMLIGNLIRESSHIFQPRGVEASANNDLVDITMATTHQHRKRKERHKSLSSQTQDKVIRSNSEERPLEFDGNRKEIRRVSSHEDFSLVKGNHRKNKNSAEQIDTSAGRNIRQQLQQRGGVGLPLHEHNSTVTHAHITVTHNQKVTNDNSHPVSTEAGDDLEHERRRSSERFARTATPRGRRNMARRRRANPKYISSDKDDMDEGSSSKENEELEQDKLSITKQPECSSEDESNLSSPSHNFLQLHPQDRDRSPSPVPSPCTPPLDLSTLHKQVDSSEPLTSLDNSSYAHRHPVEEDLVSSHVMLSPRNSTILMRRVSLDPNIPPSPPKEHNVSIARDADYKAQPKLVSKRISNLKKKLKNYEEEFELKNGYRPSHSDKMTNKDIKKMYAELNKLQKLQKEIKCLKGEPKTTMDQALEKLANSYSHGLQPTSIEDMLHEVEKHLAEKRHSSGRPEDLDKLNHEQLLEEKLSVQKALLYLENIFGRPVLREDRDLVRPLYNRYRLLKRLVIRSGPSKLKDSISELATILEHETMDFTSSPPSLTVQESAEDPQLSPFPEQGSVSSESLWVNLHSLPLSELLTQQRTTREDKKRLRRMLHEFEYDFQQDTGRKLKREDRIPMENVYDSYKKAKAKLRLLDALVAKQN